MAPRRTGDGPSGGEYASSAGTGARPADGSDRSTTRSRRVSTDPAQYHPGAERAELVAAIESRIAEAGEVAPWLGELARVMARDASNPIHSLTSRTMAAKVLVEVMGVVDAAAPVEVAADPLDQLAARREKRRSA